MKILKTILRLGLFVVINALLLCVICLAGCFLSDLVNKYIDWPSLYAIMLIVGVGIFIIIAKKLDKIL